MARSLAFKIGAVVSAIGIGTCLILIAGAVLLPSTKRARVDFEELQRLREEREASVAAPEAAAAPATTSPVTRPSTQP